MDLELILTCIGSALSGLGLAIATPQNSIGRHIAAFVLIWFGMMFAVKGWAS